jgi:hypothetical protein
MEIPTKPNQPTSDVVRFTEEEMKEIKDIREAYERLTLSLGQLYLQKRELDNSERRINTELENTENAEKVVLQKILQKYGEGTVDPDTGVFTPRK